MTQLLNYIDNQASWSEFVLFGYVCIATAVLTVMIMAYVFKYLTRVK